jgi:hypothetical protein
VEDFGVFVHVTDVAIADVAKQLADASCVMIVINSETTPWARRLLAYGALPTLSFNHRFVLLDGDAELVPQMGVKAAADIL